MFLPFNLLGNQTFMCCIRKKVTCMTFAIQYCINVNESAINESESSRNMNFGLY